MKGGALVKRKAACQLDASYKPKLRETLKKDFSKHYQIYIMMSIGVLYYIIFHYLPMCGLVMAFQNFSPAKGFFRSQWVGFDHFINFLTMPYFWRLLKNTLIINVYQLIFVFPIPIIFALLLNEVRNTKYKKVIQTCTYLPHFISMVVFCGLIVDFTAQTGIISKFLTLFGMKQQNLLMEAKYFRSIYTISSIWKETGWNSIIYVAALLGISPELYEAAVVDGANRWKQTWHVTLPGIAPTIIIMLILRIGSMMSVGFEKVILLYNPVTYETADVISSFVYRRGLLGGDFSYTTAVGLFNAVINLILLIASNKMSRKINETSLW